MKGECCNYNLKEIFKNAHCKYIKKGSVVSREEQELLGLACIFELGSSSKLME